MTNLFENITVFEFSLIFLLVLVSFYFLFLGIKDYRELQFIRLLNRKVSALITGDYDHTVELKSKSELAQLAHQLNDLSDVLRSTHDSLSQEKNRLDSILSHMTDGVLATDRSGNIVMINKTASRHLNLSREDALKMNIVDILDQENPYTYKDLVSKAPTVTVIRQNSFGEFVALRLRFALNHNTSGYISGLIVVIHDTTEQEKEERERRLFVSNVSHELRTPLTVVKSHLEALEDGALKEEVAPDFVKVSLKETDRMMRMISDLLSLSRIDNQVTALEVEMVNFTAFITAVLNRFDLVKNQLTMGGKSYELVRNYPINSIWIEIDPDKMTQVIENILNNAIKYSPDGGKITISMKTTDTQLIISITDEGLGIPKKDLPLIFDRFYRVDKARSRAQGGTGLGLAIAKEIIKLHNGFIWASSDYGKGSTFTLVLPYEKDAISFDDWEED